MYIKLSRLSMIYIELYDFLKRLFICECLFKDSVKVVKTIFNIYYLLI